MTTAVKVERLGPDGLRELAGSLCEVYERCFTEPPWHEPADQIAGYATVLAGHLGQPGMSALVVRAGVYESAGWRRRGSFTNQYGDPRVVYTHEQAG